jgi:hypothetical protein
MKSQIANIPVTCGKLLALIERSVRLRRHENGLGGGWRVEVSSRFQSAIFSFNGQRRVQICQDL